jgi:hypothetical protein
MVHILSDIIQVIMLTTSSNAFLSVNSSHPLGHITIGVNSAQENGLKLHQKNNNIKMQSSDTAMILLSVKSNYLTKITKM